MCIFVNTTKANKHNLRLYYKRSNLTEEPVEEKYCWKEGLVVWKRMDCFLPLGANFTRAIKSSWFSVRCILFLCQAVTQLEIPELHLNKAKTKPYSVNLSQFI